MTSILSNTEMSITPIITKEEDDNDTHLFGKWTMYYHLPNNNWELSSYEKIMDDIDTMEKVVVLNEKLHENVIKMSMLFVMRQGITPMWEDPQNREGGCFSYKVSNKVVADVWRTLFYHLCGETLASPAIVKHLNGITISPKKNFCIIKIWVNTTKYQDPNIIVNIPNLSQQGCIFRTHTPEF